ncbi:CSLREA domain-containing protein [Pseudomonas sp. zfem005]|uniref:CSLREA domain-containing protein n=1 Tax=Pseudomonas sp. zfem005 TaxID=3078200 RepID=UPI0029275DDC|nr:CSLREA domain-containing protein [Pseudomonas sp. zfem005]MDU9412414.1 CSLREA domain-containing protein [Pseudomonas sp. zfem005]
MTQSRTHSRTRPRLATSLMLASLLALPTLAMARDFQVTRTDDGFDGLCDADCTLRDAVEAANRLGGKNRIVLPAGVYALTLPPAMGEEGEILDEDQNLNGDLDVRAGNLTLVGAGVGASVIDGSGLDRLLEIDLGVTVLLQDLTLRNGHTTSNGGAIENFGYLVVRRVAFQDNRASYGYYDGDGGAISNRGTLEVHSSVFERNRADFGDSGRALGGAIFNGGLLTVRDSLFSENVTNGDDVVALGGALFNTGTADVARSAFLHHRADGPGIAIRNDGNGVLKLTNVTVSGKNANGEGDYDAVVANGSDYPMFAGTPSLQLVNVTIADNLTLGLLNHGRLSVRNSLIVGNGNESIGAANCLNGGDTASYQASGLLLGTDTGNCTADVHVNDADAFTRVLYPLAANGSSLPTHALRPRSPAVDAGIGSCTRHDQRGSMRPRDGDGDGMALCDLGAYERPKP